MELYLIWIRRYTWEKLAARISSHYASDIPISCSSVPLSLAVGVAFAVLSDVLSVPRFLVHVFSFVVHAEFQVGVLASEEFRWKKSYSPRNCSHFLCCCCVSFVWEIARDSPIVNTVSQTMNKHISFSWIKHENAPWLSAAKSMLPGNAKCSMT